MNDRLLDLAEELAVTIYGKEGLCYDEKETAAFWYQLKTEQQLEMLRIVAPLAAADHIASALSRLGVALHQGEQ